MKKKKLNHSKCFSVSSYNTQNKNSFQSFSQGGKTLSYRPFQICSGKLCLPLGGQKGLIPKLSLHRKKKKV